MITATGAAGSSTAASSGSVAAASKDAIAGKETFLQLLVAQIKNQNPLQPTDGIQFLTQLAQFSGLEQSIEMRKELEAIHGLLAGQNSGNGTADSASGTSGDR